MTGTRLNDCTPASDEQAKYATPDAERERQQLEQQIAMALERVEEDDRAATSSPPECALPEVDVMEIARVVLGYTADPAWIINDPQRFPDVHAVARALTEYGDQCVAKADRLRTPASDEQAKYTMNSVERVARAVRRNRFLRTGRISSFDETTPLTEGELDDARAAIVAAEIARAAAKTPEADVMKIVRDALTPLRLSPGTLPAYESADRKLCTALTAYGDQRARDARQQMLVDSTPLREAVARKARAAAIEEAAQICEADYRIDDTPHELADTIRALAAAPPQSEGGEG
jgi:hypothetical protein